MKCAGNLAFTIVYCHMVYIIKYLLVLYIIKYNSIYKLYIKYKRKSKKDRKKIVIIYSIKEILISI